MGNGDHIRHTAILRKLFADQFKILQGYFEGLIEILEEAGMVPFQGFLDLDQSSDAGHSQPQRIQGAAQLGNVLATPGGIIQLQDEFTQHLNLCFQIIDLLRFVQCTPALLPRIKNRAPGRAKLLQGTGMEVMDQETHSKR